MNYIPFTLGAYALNSIAVTIDKFLLSKNNTHPAVYVFYVSAWSLLALVLLPFSHIPSPFTILYASIAKILWTMGAYYMFKAVQVGHVSRVIPVIGTCIPLVLGIYALILGTISSMHLLAVGLLVVGLAVLTAPDWNGPISRGELKYKAYAILLFAASYIVLRHAYLQDDFFTVFVWSRPVLLLVGGAFLAIPRLRSLLKTPRGKKKDNKGSQGLFLAGQMAGGASELLLTFSISLADPALVNSLQGTQYILLFVFSLILARKFPQIFKENLKASHVIFKILGIGIISSGLYLLAFLN